MRLIILSSLALLLTTAVWAQNVPTEQERAQNREQFVQFPGFKNIEIVTEKKDQTEPLVDLIKDEHWRNFVKKMRWLDIRSLDIDMSGITVTADSLAFSVVFGVFHKFNTAASGTLNVRGDIVVKKSVVEGPALHSFSDSKQIESLLRRGAFGLFISEDELNSETLNFLDGAVKPILRNYISNNRGALMKVFEPKLSPQR